MKDFTALVHSISLVHHQLQQHAVNAVNQSLTIRNWLIGFYIVEFEQNGEDRAKYGTNLKIKGLSAPEFSRCRQFYQCYSYFLGTLSQDFVNILPKAILGTLTQELKHTDIQSIENKIKLDTKVPTLKIIAKLSYSHLSELIKIEDDLKRTFYEVECIKGTWSVRELKRQISSLHYERSGLSSKPEKLAEITHQNIQEQKVTDIIKNIYAFEFLDFKIKDAVEESDLKIALLDHLQDFILELGHGFCFEKRQKRILIGENYYFIDLLFYHRILKCHVLVELKIGEFTHGDIGQLNTYLQYVKEEISAENDNNPVGILLVANKDNALVKYATAGMDENLFVQEYLIQLPSKEQLENYINDELNRLG